MTMISGAPVPPARPKATPVLWVWVRPRGPKTSISSPITISERTIAFAAWSTTITAAQRAPARSQARFDDRARITRGSPLDQAGDDPPQQDQDDDPEHRAEVEGEAAAADRRQQAAEEVEVGVGGVGDEVEHRAQPGPVRHPRHVGD